MHTRFSLTFGMAIVTVCAGSAVADEFKPPPMRDGLWETHSARTVAGKSASDMTIRMCQTQQTIEASQALSAQLRKRNECSSKLVQQSGGISVVETRCAKGTNANEVSRTTYSHVGDTASHVELHTQRNGAEDVTVMDMKYLGSCPAGMKPGDIVMPDGKVVGSP